LHQGSQLADATALFTEDFLRVACADDDFGAGGGDADFAACVALFGEFAGEEFVEFGKEDAVGDKLVPRVSICRESQKEERKEGRFSEFNVHRCVHRRCVKSPQTRGARWEYHQWSGEEEGRGTGMLTLRFFEMGPGWDMMSSKGKKCRRGSTFNVRVALIYSAV
jgi:hypothetical protein